MDQEKALFPGSQEWAEDEERLFRILFLREYNPLLPRHWSMDFRGIPIPSLLFSQTDAETPVIYSRAGNDFKGMSMFACTEFAGSRLLSQPREP